MFIVSAGSIKELGGDIKSIVSPKEAYKAPINTRAVTAREVSKKMRAPRPQTAPTMKRVSTGVRKASRLVPANDSYKTLMRPMLLLNTASESNFVKSPI